jgi:hypothetical protein
MKYYDIFYILELYNRNVISNALISIYRRVGYKTINYNSENAI